MWQSIAPSRSLALIDHLRELKKSVSFVVSVLLHEAPLISFVEIVASGIGGTDGVKKNRNEERHHKKNMFTHPRQRREIVGDISWTGD